MKITPELVKEIADKVYAMFLSELSIHNERCGDRHRSRDRRGGY